MHRDAQQRLWIGTWFGNLVCLDKSGENIVFRGSNKLKNINWPASGLLSIAEYNDEIFIGFNGGDGVWKWNEEDKTFSQFL